MTPASPSAKESGWRFRLLGLDVVVPLNALLGIAVIALLWYPQFAGPFGGVAQAMLAVTFGVLLMASVLVHELAHAFTARRLEYRVLGISLWAMGGVTTFFPDHRHGPAREAAIAAAGPAATLLIAAVGWWVAVSTAPGSVFGAVMWALAWANVMVGLFNLLPGSPLDGGAIVRAGVWAITGSEHTGAVAAAWMGRALAVLMAAAPFLVAWFLGEPASIGAVLVGLLLAWLLWSGAGAALRNVRAVAELDSLPAAAIARPVVLVSGEASVADALVRTPDGVACVAVDPDRVPLGVLNVEFAKAVPEPERSRMNVVTACVRVDELPTVPVDATARDVLGVARTASARFVAVTGAGHAPQLVDTAEIFDVEEP